MSILTKHRDLGHLAQLLKCCAHRNAHFSFYPSSLSTTAIIMHSPIDTLRGRGTVGDHDNIRVRNENSARPWKYPPAVRVTPQGRNASAFILLFPSASRVVFISFFPFSVFYFLFFFFRYFSRSPRWGFELRRTLIIAGDRRTIARRHAPSAADEAGGGGRGRGAAAAADAAGTAPAAAAAVAGAAALVPRAPPAPWPPRRTTGGAILCDSSFSSLR
jgi:hypothetical protein